MVMSKLEHKLGLPPLSQIKDSVAQVNALLQNLDDKRLQGVKHITDNLVKLQSQGGEGGLRLFADVVRLISNTPMEKLEAVDKIIAQASDTSRAVERIIKCLPKDMLDSLSLKDIAEEVKKAVREE